MKGSLSEKDFEDEFADAPGDIRNTRSNWQVIRAAVIAAVAAAVAVVGGVAVDALVLVDAAGHAIVCAAAFVSAYVDLAVYAANTAVGFVSAAGLFDAAGATIFATAADTTHAALGAVAFVGMLVLVACERSLPQGVGRAALRIEAALSQQQFHQQQMIYRNYKAVDFGDENLPRSPSDRAVGCICIESATDEEVPQEERQASDSEGEEEQQGGVVRQQLKELLDFDGRHLSGGQGVRALAYHPIHRDTLCAALSSPPCSIDAPRSGQLQLWSIANPLYPQRTISCKSGVTTLGFGSQQPNLLAGKENSSSNNKGGGMVDGGIGIWDLRLPKDQPVLHSAGSEGAAGCQHTDTVWDLQWLLREGTEGLLSTGGDGQVLQWRLVNCVVMNVRRTPNPSALQLTGPRKEAPKAHLFRYSAGLSLDLARGEDSSIYFVAADDGVVHKCSLNYNEQFLSTYYGHKGPVKTVRVSPFSPHFLLTGSADWTVRLWAVGRHQEESEVFASTESPSAVMDVCWSPYDSTAFCCVFNNGRIELWNCSDQTADPAAVLYPSFGGERVARQLTQIRYAPCVPVVVVGDEEGRLSLISIQEEEVPAYSRQEQQDRLEQAFQCRASQQRGETLAGHSSL
ncbi:axonemal inner arm I1 intermediate chain dynein IC138, putative [Eimeria maxima]|uniref:Dynein axonemal intermediate chain 4 n=1 Tax=Eimeria maxima TaxID=5804 RepID=U6MFK1_EIMMA|nr:axonemal inner arm I1 intermediate chain dynein IC138, putative [Eimeria maxima]CDJ60435.1 axonemal inner arm I1 intermediate chain dynein IC138, putative [Eimeria maxima]